MAEKNRWPFQRFLTVPYENQQTSYLGLDPNKEISRHQVYEFQKLKGRSWVKYCTQQLGHGAKVSGRPKAFPIIISLKDQD